MNASRSFCAVRGAASRRIPAPSPPAATNARTDLMIGTGVLRGSGELDAAHRPGVRMRLPVEPADEDTLPEDMSLHGLEDVGAGRVRRQVELRVQREQFERVMVMRTG